MRPVPSVPARRGQHVPARPARRAGRDPRWGMAERVVVPARNAVPIGDLDPLQAAPMTDAGMTALRAVERARPWLTADTAAVVVGVGGLGHLAVQYIASTTDARVIAIDVDQTRLDWRRGSAPLMPFWRARDAPLASGL
jgi:alcohol dehydrogenase, propanol-preferring